MHERMRGCAHAACMFRLSLYVQLYSCMPLVLYRIMCVPLGSGAGGFLRYSTSEYGTPAGLRTLLLRRLSRYYILCRMPPVLRTRARAPAPQLPYPTAWRRLDLSHSHTCWLRGWGMQVASGVHDDHQEIPCGVVQRGGSFGT